MKYEFLIGLRYTRAQHREGGSNQFISFIALISMLGLALGVAALIIVLSVMNGFQKELRERILGVVSHIQVSSESGELADWSHVIQGVARHPQVRAAAPFVQQQGMLSFDGQVRGVMVRGIVPKAEETVADFSRHMQAGKLTQLVPGEFGIVLGTELAHGLQVHLGDKVTLLAPQGLVTPAAILPRVKQFRVVGIFDVGMFEFDSGLALIEMSDAQKMYRMDDRVSGVRLKQRAAPGTAVAYESQDIPGLTLEVLPAQTLGWKKCERCWTFSPRVGEDAAHPQLCERCGPVVRALRG